MLKQTILMTGATSFIGTHLLAKLVNEGYRVIALKRPESGPTFISDMVKWVDITSIDSTPGMLNDIYSIIHIATDYGRTGSSLVEQYICNVVLPLKLLELMSEYDIKRFVSTDSFFGKFEKDYAYMRTYIASKRHFVDLCKIYASEHPQISIQNLRLEHVYGEKDKLNKLIPFIINKLKNNETIDCTLAMQKRDFIYINDVVSAYLKILNNDFSSGYFEFEVGTGTAFTLKTMFETLKLKMNSTSQINYGSITMREDEIMESVADTSALNRLGWSAKYSLNDGVDSMLGIARK
ncbi:NAD-dependent epimerase/dehydratase family protein [Buttiauxella ferragutiae]|uniref:NAD-dependent epimerase/dehydratase family protein n=1 Tax=Buttiauxella ferragutiae TaxID=82989 RepID=UPI00352559BC